MAAENEAAAVATETSRASRDWTPIDNYNEKFIHLVKKREEEAGSLLYDHEKTNKVSLVMQFQYIVVSLNLLYLTYQCLMLFC